MNTFSFSWRRTIAGLSLGALLLVSSIQQVFAVAGGSGLEVLPTEVLNSGVGTGPDDQDRSYQNISSDINITPRVDWYVAQVKPGISGCVGNCMFTMRISNSDGATLAEVQQWATDMHEDLNGKLSRVLLLKAGETYKIHFTATSDRTIRLSLTGRSAGVGRGVFTVVGSDTHGVQFALERGSLAFSVIAYVSDPSLSRTPQVKVLTPGGGEVYRPGDRIPMSWMNGTEKVLLYFMDASADLSLPIEDRMIGGLISHNRPVEGSYTWDGKTFCDLEGKNCNEKPLTPGKYKILAVSKDRLGNYAIGSQYNAHLSSTFHVISSTEPTSTQVKVLNPKEGDKFQEGKLNVIRWSGGKRAVKVGLVDRRFDAAKNPEAILGWIPSGLDVKPDSIVPWTALQVTDLTQTVTWNVKDLSKGPYRILVVDSDSCISSSVRGQPQPCNIHVSGEFTISSTSTPSPTTPPVEYEDEVRVYDRMQPTGRIFYDLEPGSAVYKGAHFLANNNISNGCSEGKFCADRSVNRAEMAKFFLLSQFETITPGTSASKFWDVIPGEWYEKYVNKAAELGIFQGYEDGSVRPQYTVTRAEFACMAQRTYGLSDKLPHKYQDLKGHWATKCAGTWALAYPDVTVMKPDTKMTRGEVAVTLYLLLNGLKM